MTLTKFTSTAAPRTELLAAANTSSPNKVTLITGQSLIRGTVLGLITASGKYTKSLSAAADGSQTPVAILAQDCDATAADAECLIYERGDFLDVALILGTAHTIASIRSALRAVGITIVPVGPLA